LNPDPDPAFQVNPHTDPVPDPGFWWPKLKKKIQLEKNLSFLKKKIAIYLLILGLLKGGPSYRRSLQPSKEDIQHFLFLWVLFALLDPDPDPGSNPDPDPQHWYRVLLT
jgi:hypothetical protein